MVVPVLAIGLASEVGPFGYNVRHVVWVFIPLAVWIGAGLARWRQSRAVIAGGLVLLGLSAISIINRQVDPRYRNEDAAAVANLIRARGEWSTVFVSAGYMAGPLDHYLASAQPAIPLPTIQPNNGSLEQAIAMIASRIGNHDRCWLAYSRPFHGDPAGLLLPALATRFTVARAPEVFAGFELYELSPGEP
jgi:hypothetical protein